MLEHTNRNWTSFTRLSWQRWGHYGMWRACQIQKPSALSLKLPSLCCVLGSYTLFISFVLSYSTSMLSCLSHVAATSYSPSHIYLSFLSPYYLCARPRGLSHDLVSMCVPFSFYSLVSAPHVRFAWCSLLGLTQPYGSQISMATWMTNLDKNFDYPAPRREAKVQHLAKNPSSFIDSNCFFIKSQPTLILR